MKIESSRSGCESRGAPCLKISVRPANDAGSPSVRRYPSYRSDLLFLRRRSLDVSQEKRTSRVTRGEGGDYSREITAGTRISSNRKSERLHVGSPIVTAANDINREAENKGETSAVK